MKIRTDEEVHCLTWVSDHYVRSQSPTRLNQRHYSQMSVGVETNKTGQLKISKPTRRRESDVRFEQSCVLPSSRALEMRL